MQIVIYSFSCHVNEVKHHKRMESSILIKMLLLAVAQMMIRFFISHEHCHNNKSLISFNIYATLSSNI